jgi:predicted nucleic acid-binding protein
MKPPRIYLDTSVLGGAFDVEFEQDTKALLGLIRSGEMLAVISELTELELRGAPDEAQELLAELLDLGAEDVRLSAEAQEPANAYIAAGVVSLKYRADAVHIALATLAKVDVLVSWNFKHIVNFLRIRGFNGVNLMCGYGTLDIRSPKEVRVNADSQTRENL